MTHICTIGFESTKLLGFGRLGQLGERFWVPYFLPPATIPSPSHQHTSHQHTSTGFGQAGGWWLGLALAGVPDVQKTIFCRFCQLCQNMDYQRKFMPSLFYCLA